MPTDLPPDYKPKPKSDPNDPADPNEPGAVPAFPPVGGEDALDPNGSGAGGGSDVVDPPGWSVPPVTPGGDRGNEPLPAGMPTF